MQTTNHSGVCMWYVCTHSTSIFVVPSYHTYISYQSTHTSEQFLIFGVGIMGFGNGSEAFKGVGAPSLKSEVSGESRHPRRLSDVYISLNVSHGSLSLCFSLCSHRPSNGYHESTPALLVSSNTNRVVLDSQELNASSTVSRFFYQCQCLPI